MLNTKKLETTEQIEENIIENFFKLWIAKIFIYDNKYEVFYNNFIDENNKLNTNKLDLFIDYIYSKISTSDITNIKPNNISSILKKDDIVKIISNFVPENFNTQFSSDIFTFLELWNHKDFRFSLDYKDFPHSPISKVIVTLWFENYIKKLYNILSKWKLTMNEDLRKIIDFIRKKVIHAIETKK